MPEPEVNQIIGHLFRQEAGKMAAVLTRLLGFENLDQAEDIVQDTLVKALSVWKIKGIPENPPAWLYTVAKRKAIDLLRQQKLHASLHHELERTINSEWVLAPAVNKLFLENEIEDSQLRMIFACCHPSIPYDSQIALTLKTLCGLSIGEIARSFLTTEETITKRLYRAREKIRSEKIDLEVPDPKNLPSRIDAVLHTLYLLFNEGYNSSHDEQLIRHDLCEEAMRLCLLLTGNTITAGPKINALLALMCFQASRAEARISASGGIILLKDQDRSLWNWDLIKRGQHYLNLASESTEVTEYHIEAAIAAHHAFAPSFEKTNWSAIYHLYDALSDLKPGPIVDMNKAIALGYSDSAQAGLKALLEIKGLEETHFYFAALGDFYHQVNDRENSRKSYSKAVHLTSSKTEKILLEEKMKKLG